MLSSDTSYIDGSFQPWYIDARLADVDSDFLQFEVQAMSKQDSELIMNLFYALEHEKRKPFPKLPNPHNSCLLYVTGLSDEFNFDKARADTKGGSPPDVDIDYDKFNRHKVVEWVAQHWGKDKVANIITHGTFGLKSIIERWYKVTEQDPNIANALRKKLPPPKFGKAPSLEDLLKLSPEIKEAQPEFVKVAERLEGLVTQFGFHAAGVVISDDPISDVVPTWRNKKSDLITQWDMHEVEQHGLIKFDFLGLANITILAEAARLIKQHRGLELDLYRIPDGDLKAYTLLEQGYLEGIFQMEANSTPKEYFRDIAPRSIEEIADITSLNRPGPQEAGLDTKYIENKKLGYSTEEMPAVVENILKKTQYTVVYQEQVIQLCEQLAGFDPVEADDVRRAMGKKDMPKLIAKKPKFIQGAAKRGFDAEYVSRLWDDLLGFAEYCFNKAHAVNYSLITYLCAYLKANYTSEFFCALLSVRSMDLQPKDWAYTVPRYVQEAKDLGVHVFGPSINSSDMGFTMSKDKVYFGFGAIRSVGQKASEHIVKVRGTQPFSSLEDFIFRIDLSTINTRVFQSLVVAGVFDQLGYSRKELLEKTEALYAHIKSIDIERERLNEIEERNKEIEILAPTIQRRKELQAKSKKKGAVLAQGEQDFLDETEGLRSLRPLAPKPRLDLPTFQRQHILKLELNDVIAQAQQVGCFLDSNPVATLFPKSFSISKLTEDHIDKTVTIAGVISETKYIKNRRGQPMAFLQISDENGFAEVTLFSNVLQRQQRQFETWDIVQVVGRLEAIEPVVKVVVESISAWS